MILKTATLSLFIAAFLSCQTNKEDLSLVLERTPNNDSDIGLHDQFSVELNQIKESILKRMNDDHVPGLSIAVINDYKVEWSDSLGVLTLDINEKVTKESCFEAAFVTKMCVATLVLHLVDKGLLDLDQDVNTYLISWTLPDNDFTKNKKVTLRLLCSHQSGIPASNTGFV